MTWDQRGERKGAKRLPERQRLRILAKYPECWLRIPGRCTGESTEVDHVVDAEDGGSDEDENLRGACHECHEYKSAVNSQRRSVAKQNEWKRKPPPHPGVLPD
jgi:5-methylcytosine-specific restriction enzyme A